MKYMVDFSYPQAVSLTVTLLITVSPHSSLITKLLVGSAGAVIWIFYILDFSMCQTSLVKLMIMAGF